MTVEELTQEYRETIGELQAIGLEMARLRKKQQILYFKQSHIRQDMRGQGVTPQEADKIVEELEENS